MSEENKRDFHYTRDGHGIIDAVAKMFANGTFALGEGDALIPIQNAFIAWKEYHKSGVKL